MDKDYTVEDLLTDETFTDYCLNENSDHKIKWDNILAGNEHLQKTADEARQMHAILSPALPQREIDTEVNKIRQALALDEYLQPTVRKSNSARVLLLSLTILSLVTIATYFLAPRKTSHQQVSKFETRLGERKQYILPDGSTVILNSNSSFSFDEKFGNSDRLIELTGDAFFKVAKNPLKTFIVKSKGYSTTSI